MEKDGIEKSSGDAIDNVTVVTRSTKKRASSEVCTPKSVPKRKKTKTKNKESVTVNTVDKDLEQMEIAQDKEVDPDRAGLDLKLPAHLSNDKRVTGHKRLYHKYFI